MSRRLEVELTSKREDGTYTWRAAGAKQPKGELDGALLYEGAAVGDVVRAEAEFAVDGVFIVAVQPPKAKRAMPETSLTWLLDNRSLATVLPPRFLIIRAGGKRCVGG